MEDNSYVNLSLQKYNELYDKAKKYDELTKELGDKISESISTIVDNFNKMFTTDDKEQDSKYNVELIEDYGGIPKGAKGIDLQPNCLYPHIKWDKFYDNCYIQNVDGITYENVYAVDRDYLKLINNKEEK